MKSGSFFRWAAWPLPLAFLACTAAAFAQDSRITPTAITTLLQEFLAHTDEPAEHDRFWADDLVYTNANGEVTTKAAILQNLAGAKNDPAKPKETFTAEDILVRPYGTTAALTFRLVRRTANGKAQYYRNSGTVVLRDGKWQVVTWQATRVSAAH